METLTGGHGPQTSSAVSAVEIKRALEPAEKAAAKERQQQGRRDGAKEGGRGKTKPSGQVSRKESRAGDNAAKAKL